MLYDIIDVEWRCHMFSTGQYRDKTVRAGDEMNFKEKVVIVDAFNIDWPVAVPFWDEVEKQLLCTKSNAS